MLAQVELLKRLLVLCELPGNSQGSRWVRWPVSRREHVDLQVALQIEASLEGAVRVGDHHIARKLHVFEHALQFVSKGRPALLLEFGYHRFLRIDGSALPQQQPLGQILLEKRLEHILALNVAKQRHDPIQQGLQLYVRHTLASSTQLQIDEFRDELCRLVLPHVDARLKRILQSVRQLLIAREGLLQQRVEDRFEIQQIRNQILVPLLIRDHLHPRALDVSAQCGANARKPIHSPQ
mmetsp:Transcript_17091/g.41725  ORF Transcript_17091/g.41725 Transcript_17091/m.41725 type:complete len:237 (-) Transcript_17091:900-1610(-)